MAKGAATEQVMGDLHEKVATVFLRILKKYEGRMDAADAAREAEDELANTLLTEDVNPAMMSAITKFLKDNSIEFDTEEIQKLTDTEQRLNARRQKRGNLVQLGQLALVEPHE